MIEVGWFLFTVAAETRADQLTTLSRTHHGTTLSRTRKNRGLHKGQHEIQWRNVT